MVTFLGLMPFWIAFARFIPRRSGGPDMGGTDKGALLQQQAFVLQRTVIAARTAGASWCLSSRCRNFLIVVSLGMGALKVRGANWRIGMI